ncbi:TonB family protein [Mucilaginibacter mali]|uniref:TonB family protein n=1 Tax=Mucilaginibacter mali TaxID=2740462 RepID=A0A7D4QCR1_9SPHI|nr:energy transducer TonB [Mucilaginibacter mali]QKJ32485.1 TonB family protein [Mucilaginibacter mali]
MKVLLKTTFVVVAFLLATTTLTVNAQNKPAKPTPPKSANSNAVFTAVEQAASFPGGLEKFGPYLAKTIKYPAKARKNNVQGKVFVQFVVEKDGSLANMKVLRGIGSGCDEEAIRALKNGPKWIPGKQNGKIVRSEYTVPISFQLAKV